MTPHDTLTEHHTLTSHQVTPASQRLARPLPHIHASPVVFSLDTLPFLLKEVPGPSLPWLQEAALRR